MQYNIFNIGGKMIKNNDVYQVYDNTDLKNLTISQTILHGGQSTKGHFHDGIDEVYLFLGGKGKIEIDGEMFDIEEDSMFLIPGGKFHRVHNTVKNSPIVFLSIFQSYDRNAKQAKY